MTVALATIPSTGFLRFPRPVRGVFLFHFRCVRSRRGDTEEILVRSLLVLGVCYECIMYRHHGG